MADEGSYLGNAAYRAGMANVPGDYSDTYKAILKNYEKSMQRTSLMWENITKVAVGIGKHIMKEMDGPAPSGQITDLLSSDVGANLKSELTRIRDGIGATYNPKNLLTKENKENRAALIKERNDIYSKLEYESSWGDKVNALINGKNEQGLPLINIEKTDPWVLEQASLLQGAQTGNPSLFGNSYVLNQDDNGDWKYFMQHDPEKISLEAPGIPDFPQPITKPSEFQTKAGPIKGLKGVSAKDIHDGLVTNEALAKMKEGLDGFYEHHLETGASGKPMTYIENNRVISQIKEIKESPLAWQTATAYSVDNKSWKEQMTSVSPASANDWGKIVEAFSGEDGVFPSKDDLPEKHPLRAIADIDEDGKLSPGDIVGINASENYNRYTLALFSPSDKNYSVEATGNAFAYHTELEVTRVREHAATQNRGVQLTQQQKNEQAKQREIAAAIAASKFEHLTKAGELTLGPQGASANIKKGQLGPIRQSIEAGVPFVVGNVLQVTPIKIGPKAGGWYIRRNGKDPDTNEPYPIKSFENTTKMILNGLNTMDIGFKDLKQFSFKPFYEYKIPGAFDPHDYKIKKDE